VTAPRSSRVLLLGASGFLGPHLSARLGERALATYHTHPLPGAVPFDARSSLLESLGADFCAGVIMLGITNIDACARDPARSAATNVAAIIRVIDELRALGALPVFVSSDAVFDGSRGGWRETDDAQPILTYGLQKRTVERYLESSGEPALAVRLPKLIAPEPDARCMVSQWVGALGSDQAIRCATDQFFTPAGAADAAQAIAGLIDAGARGLFHVGGPERLSRRGLLDAVLEEYRMHATPRARIVHCSLRDIPVLEPRPLDTSMDSGKLRALGGPILRPASEVARLAVQAHFRGRA